MQRVLPVFCTTWIVALLLCLSTSTPTICQENNLVDEQQEEQPTQPIINNIIVRGNNLVDAQAILQVVPYQTGEHFSPERTRQLVVNLYGLGYFRNIIVLLEQLNKYAVNLVIEVDEKIQLESVTYQGNRYVTQEEIEKKINFAEIPAVDEYELEQFARIIKKVYASKNYHFATVEPKLEIVDNHANLTFDIKEGKQAMVRRVNFIGNDNVPDKFLRDNIFTREDWVLGFMDSAGQYNPDMVDMDRHIIENIYQTKGYIGARVIDVDVELVEDTKSFNVTFEIEEGHRYLVTEVHAPGNDLLDESELLKRVIMLPGYYYNRQAIAESINRLRLLWGEHGYVDANINPIVVPDEDNHTVSITFQTELGNQLYLNRLNIVGNRRTRDKVIRRLVTLEEGQLITNNKMDMSKNRVELLGYFDKRDGVNWRINRVSEDTADLDLMLNEAKARRISAQLAAGGSPKNLKSAITGLTFSGEWEDSNFLGRGIHTSANAKLSRSNMNFIASIYDPWLFDRPLSGGIEAYYQSQDYEDLKDLAQEVTERRGGMELRAGYLLPWSRDLNLSSELRLEKIMYNPERPTASPLIRSPEAREQYQQSLNQRFEEGTLAWLGLHLGQDLRNHPDHPTKGYQWSVVNKIAPGISNFGFYKFEGDASWYTPIIGEHDLVLCLHGHAGFTTELSKKSIPYRELYHIGGPATVRGFTFGQIGPTFLGNSLGGRNMFFVNTELIWPIAPDYSFKVHVFYDGGAGWDTPGAATFTEGRLQDNDFEYRHAIGFGFRMLSPFPMQIDWGFKLDRRRGEDISQVHFSMNHYY